MRGGFVCTLIKNGNRGNDTSWVMSMGGGGGGGGGGVTGGIKTTLTAMFLYFISSVDICL